MTRQIQHKLGHGLTNNSSETMLIPSRDGKSVTIQTTAYPIEHKECGYYWLTSSRMKYITCAGCGNTIHRVRNLTLFRGDAS